jgi:zinc transporter ZupT
MLILVQAAMTPIGIGIGWTLSYSSGLVKGIIYAIAAGPYLYISSVEILQVPNHVKSLGRVQHRQTQVVEVSIHAGRRGVRVLVVGHRAEH